MLASPACEEHQHTLILACIQTKTSPTIDLSIVGKDSDQATQVTSSRDGALSLAPDMSQMLSDVMTLTAFHLQDCPTGGSLTLVT